MDKAILKYNWVLFFWIICLPAALKGQDLKGSLNQMRAAYKQMTDLHIKMHVAIYAAKGAAMADYRLEVDIKKKGDNYLYQYGDNAMLMNDKYFIIADGASNEMVCSRRNESEDPGITNAFNFDLDSILSFYERPEYLGREKQVDRYTVEQKTGPVSQLHLAIDVQTNLLEQMGYQYRQGPYVKIDFVLFDGSVSFGATTFDEGRFVAFRNGKMVTAEQYSNYHLVETVSD